MQAVGNIRRREKKKKGEIKDGDLVTHKRDPKGWKKGSLKEHYKLLFLDVEL